MDAQTQTAKWQAAAKTRKGPGQRRACRVPAVYDEANPPFACGVPAVLVLSVTTDQGALAPWCTQAWFNDRLSVWGYAKLEVVIAPTPGALLHKQVQDCLCVVRRVTRNWRLIGQTDGSGLASTSSIDRLLNSAYDEVQLNLTDRLQQRDDGRPRSMNRIMNAMRDLVDIRDRREQQRPTIVWRYNPTTIGEAEAERVEQMARQIRVDRVIRTAAEDFQVDF